MFYSFRNRCRSPAWQARVMLAIIGLPVSFVLAGCLSDDSHLARSGTRVVIPASTTPASTVRSSPAGADSIAGIGSDALGRRYFIAIGGLELENHSGDDFASEPDIFVQVQRRDPAILLLIRGTEERRSALRDRERANQDELDPLLEKKRNSEIIPGKPLSQAQLRRLAEISRGGGGNCSEAARPACRACGRNDERLECRQCRECDQLRSLLELKAASEVVPGPPLSPAELARLRELEEADEQIFEGLVEARKEIELLRSHITGKTDTITTAGLTLDYGFRAIKEVYPGDELWITVYDEDIGDDDVYGSMPMHMVGDALNGGDMTITMPNIRSLDVRIIVR